MSAARALFVHQGAYTTLGFVADQAKRRGFTIESIRSPGPDLDPRHYGLVTVLGSERSVYDDSLEWLDHEARFGRTAF